MFHKILIANRGEIAGRIGAHVPDHGHSDSRGLFRCRPVHPHQCSMRTNASGWGLRPAGQSYLDVESVLAACRATECAGGSSGLRLPVGERRFRRTPRHRGHRLHRAEARDISATLASNIRPAPSPRASGVPLLPGSDLLADVDAALTAAERVGYPIMPEEHGRRRRHRHGSLREC